MPGFHVRMATASVRVQEPPRLSGALRAQQGGGTLLDLAYLMSSRPKEVAQARIRRSKQGADCFSWARFAGASHGAKDGGAAEARITHQRFLKSVSDMLGSEVSSEQLHGAARLVFDVLSCPNKSPADKRAELVAAIGFVEQELLKAVIGIVDSLHKWRQSAGDPDCNARPEAPGHEEGAREQAPASRRPFEIRKDRAVNWGRDLDNLPLYDSDGDVEEEQVPSDGLGAAGLDNGDEDHGGDPVEYLEARLINHCAGLGLNAEAVVEDVFRVLSSSRGMDEVQSMLCDLIGFEGLDLVTDLLQNRTSIAVHVSIQREEREKAEANKLDLAQPVSFGGFSVTTAANQQLMKQMKKEERRRRKEDTDDDKDGWLRKQGLDPAVARALAGAREKREAELAAGPQNSSRGGPTFDGTVAGFAGALKLVLPPGTRRILHEKDNYEEILVPPQTKAPVRGNERRIPTTEFAAFCQPAFEGTHTHTHTHTHTNTHTHTHTLFLCLYIYECLISGTCYE